MVYHKIISSKEKVFWLLVKLARIPRLGNNICVSKEGSAWSPLKEVMMLKQKSLFFAAWLAAAPLTGCINNANSEEPQELPPMPRAQPASELPLAKAKEAPKAEPSITPPPGELLISSLDLKSVEKNLYIPFGDTYFRLWGGAPTGSQPKGVSLSPDGASVFVTNFGQNASKNVFRYDPETLEVKAKAKFPGNAIESVVSADGARLYVSNFDNQEMLELDAETLAINRRFKVGNMPKHFALSKDEAMIYVSNWGSGTVSFLELESGKEVGSVVVGANPRGTAVTHDGKRLYVANFGSDTVSVIDVATQTALKTIATAHAPRHITISKDDKKVYVSCYGDTKVHVIDAATDEIERTVEVGAGPKTIELSKDEKFFYTADYRGNTMSIVNTQTWETLILPVPTVKTSGLAVSPDDRRIYLTGWDSINLLVFERMLPGDVPSALGPKAPGATCNRATKQECLEFP
jgi:YVTN family beta-propeller protein